MKTLEEKIKDIINWIKSDISKEERPKLGKTATPYRTEKLRFLRKLETMLTEASKPTTEESNIELVKHTVCTSCFGVGIRDTNCICTYQNNYETIDLEFETCKCCGNLICDGHPADTEFNDNQFKKLKSN